MDGVKILNPKRLNEETLSVETVKVWGMHNVKPSIGVINDKELVMFTCHQHMEEFAHDQLRPGTGPMLIHSVMYRSHDGGKTWESGNHTPFRGYEPTVTMIDGVMFVQTHFFQRHKRYEGKETCIGYLYRSEDRGETWTETKLDSEFLGADFNGKSLCPTRNLLKLKDGSIILFVNSDSAVFRMRSTDMGLSWAVEPVRDTINHHPQTSMFYEAVQFCTPSGRLMMLSRVVWELIYDDLPHRYHRDQEFDTDNGMGLLLMESFDDGLTWHGVRGVGDIGMMYPSLEYLDDRRFVLTYTQRLPMGKVYPHMGVQAVLGQENPDGSFELDFGNDVIVLDDKTPDYTMSGSGYGMTRKLSDGTLITPYSYRMMTPFCDRVMKNREYLDSDDLFIDLATRSGNARYVDGPEMPWWQGSSDEWKKVIIMGYMEFMHESWCPTEVVRWKIKL